MFFVGTEFFRSLLDLLAAGLTQQQVLKELPDLEAEDISASLRFSSSRLNHPILQREDLR